ncbi:MAG: fuculose phosphate aldolase [Rhizobiales bacterium NRL2]|jgi:L-fuculose-phosphate aldolase|nr:MAG: fuculose phosphate aldolase [Rhizobiales bacterium NRL2]
MADAAATLLAACRAMETARLSPGTSGNLSARDGDGFWITPSGLAYDALDESMMVFMNLDGGWKGDLKPSSEWRFHLDIYRARPDAGGICHTHSLNATALATRREGIPAFHYMVAAAGGRDIRCAPYRTFGTQELSDAALKALEDRRACLLANHGVIALGETVEKALKLAQEVENLAAQYILARQLGGPAILSDGEMDVVLEKFRTYGQQPARTG